MAARNRPDWPAIKAAYLQREGSFRELATRYAVSFHTLAKRAKREDWTGQLARLDDAIATTVTETAIAKATEQGNAVGISAGKFVERTLANVRQFLDKIEALANSPNLDPQALRSLTSSFRDVVDVGRKTHRLDDQKEQGPIDIKALCTEVINVVPLAEPVPPLVINPKDLTPPDMGPLSEDSAPR